MVAAVDDGTVDDALQALDFQVGILELLGGVVARVDAYLGVVVEVLYELSEMGVEVGGRLVVVAVVGQQDEEEES